MIGRRGGTGIHSHIQRIVLATMETTVTPHQSAIDLLSNNPNPACGHKELRRSTGHIMVITRYSDQQGSKSRQEVKRLYSISRATSIDSDCVVAYPRPPFSATKRTNYAPTSFDQQLQVSEAHHTEMRKIEIPRSMVVKALSW